MWRDRAAPEGFRGRVLRVRGDAETTGPPGAERSPAVGSPRTEHEDAAVVVIPVSSTADVLAEVRDWLGAFRDDADARSAGSARLTVVRRAEEGSDESFHPLRRTRVTELGGE